MYEYGAGGGLTATALMNTGQGGGLDRENLFTIAAYASHGAVARALLGCQGGQTGWGQSWNRALLPARMVTDIQLKNNSALDPETMNLNEVGFALEYTDAEGDPGYEDGGNITSVKRFAKVGSISQPVLSFTYGYDALNRLAGTGLQTSADGTVLQSGTYGYTMDAWGNLLERTKSGSTGLPGARTMSVDSANGVPVTNRLAGQDYDILGNMTSHSATIEGQTQSQTLEYLDQGHIARILTGSGATLATAWRYYYDADGKRRIKAEGPAPGTGTPPLTPAEAFTNSSFSFYAGEDLICQMDTGTQVAESAPGVPDAATYAPKFLLTDHLGTTRAELTFDEDHDPVIAKIYDYMPYGEEIAPAADVTEQLKFTGKQRDTESGLDFFGARYFSQPFFRMISPDQVFADNTIYDPNSWNLYSYVRLNPLNWLDPTGMKLKSTQIETLRNIVGEEYADQIKDEDNDGYIDSLSVTDLDILANEGLSMLNDLINSNNTYCYEEDGFIQTKAGPSITKGDVENLDVNPDWRYSKGKTDRDKPPEGIHDMVVLDRNISRLDETGKKLVTKTAIAFHELAEAYAKIEFGVPRSFDPKSIMDTGRQSAHQYAIEREKLWLFQRPSVTEAPAGGNNLQKPGSNTNRSKKRR